MPFRSPFRQTSQAFRRQRGKTLAVIEARRDHIEARRLWVLAVRSGPSVITPAEYDFLRVNLRETFRALQLALRAASMIPENAEV